MTMDDMAVEWVEQVLSFQSITDVYKCRSVCKKWQAAANYVISDWTKLELVVREIQCRFRYGDENRISRYKTRFPSSGFR